MFILTFIPHTVQKQPYLNVDFICYLLAPLRWFLLTSASPAMLDIELMVSSHLPGLFRTILQAAACAIPFLFSAIQPLRDLCRDPCREPREGGGVRKAQSSSISLVYYLSVPSSVSHPTSLTSQTGGLRAIGGPHLRCLHSFTHSGTTTASPRSPLTHSPAARSGSSLNQEASRPHISIPT